MSPKLCSDNKVISIRNSALLLASAEAHRRRESLHKSREAQALAVLKGGAGGLH